MIDELWDKMLKFKPFDLDVFQLPYTSGKRTNCNRKNNWRVRNRISRKSRQRNR